MLFKRITPYWRLWSTLRAICLLHWEMNSRERGRLTMGAGPIVKDFLWGKTQNSRLCFSFSATIDVQLKMKEVKVEKEQRQSRLSRGKENATENKKARTGGCTVTYIHPRQVLQTWALNIFPGSSSLWTLLCLISCFIPALSLFHSENIVLFFSWHSVSYKPQEPHLSSWSAVENGQKMFNKYQHQEDHPSTCFPQGKELNNRKARMEENERSSTVSVIAKVVPGMQA